MTVQFIWISIVLIFLTVLWIVYSFEIFYQFKISYRLGFFFFLIIYFFGNLLRFKKFYIFDQLDFFTFWLFWQVIFNILDTFYRLKLLSFMIWRHISDIFDHHNIIGIFTVWAFRTFLIALTFLAFLPKIFILQFLIFLHFLPV